MTARHIHGLSMQAAAKQLGISRNALFALLRTHGHLNADNTPRHHLVREGLFTVDTRAFNNRVSGIRRHYTVTLVTGTGLSWLHSLVNDEPKPRPIPASRRPDPAAADTGRNENRHRPGARKVA